MEESSVTYHIDSIKKRITDKQQEIIKRILNRTKDIAEETTQVMRTTLATAKNPTGKLASLLDVSVSRRENTLYFRLVDKDKLNSLAPYWYVLNYGKTKKGKPFIPPKNIGHWEGNTWVHVGTDGLIETEDSELILKEGEMLLRPKKFTPINYLTMGLRYAKEKLRRIPELIRQK